MSPLLILMAKRLLNFLCPILLHPHLHAEPPKLQVLELFRPAHEIRSFLKKGLKMWHD